MTAYEEQKDSIVAQDQSLREQNLKATIAAEQNQQASQARWEWEQERFFGAAENKQFVENKLLMGAFDTTVKDLANDPKNASRPGSWFLEEARKIVSGTFNIGNMVESPSILFASNSRAHP